MRSLSHILLFCIFLILPFPIREVFLLGGPNGQSFNEYRDISLYLFEILTVLYCVVTLLCNKEFTKSIYNAVFHVEHTKAILLLLFLILIFFDSTASLFINFVLFTKWVLYLLFGVLIYSELKKDLDVPRGTSACNLLNLFHVEQLRKITGGSVPRGTLWDNIAKCSTWNILALSISISLFLQVAVEVIQIILQKSVGLTYLFEPVLDPSIGGVATVIIDGHEVLRGYGTFLHPNILGMFIVSMLSFLILAMFPTHVPRGTPGELSRKINDSFGKSNVRGMFHVEHTSKDVLIKAFFAIFMLLGILLTVSKTIIGGIFALSAYWLFLLNCSTWNTGFSKCRKLFHPARMNLSGWVEQSIQQTWKDVPRGTMSQPSSKFRCSTWNIGAAIFLFLILVVLILVFSGIDRGAFFLQPILERKTQYLSILSIPWQHWFLGLGFSGYITFLMGLHPEYALWQYQPIHNFWITASLELGILPILILAVLFYEKGRQLWGQFHRLPFLLKQILGSILAILFLGTLADHYFWDIEQAQFFFVFMLTVLVLAVKEGESFLQSPDL